MLFLLAQIYSKYRYSPLFESLCYATSLLQKTHIGTVFDKQKKSKIFTCIKKAQSNTSSQCFFLQ